uniref:Protochlorophyllide reductase n=1 Tax=Entomoneis paludosa TaxID=265537 RepID=A0A7S2YEB9_9STRA|mmetsp:Transcript_29229/g.61165  ORF Transcript_29229/g.61165 Transcript_29229/m.61165 type:complete len:327 (+) Transcript_29229:305-1285(+)|eukprot:CAMPEP_0172465142 /NCGR_PEP_ID=MMETSP1065-20121228/52574_1 /TAXON_ID=265537 /ORGANISM="Amphiprora paludosa, Strain CCMP125" /LENGTH=326 /DNA_ID=CAMNT_0013221577 /DNA_START=193 /DNA_END=1173 /DNA_ORIENTATION=-
MPTPLRCDPALFEKDLTGQVIIVTGANSGCGLETTRQLVKQKATVIMACRNETKGQQAAQDVGGVFVAPMDLASLESVRNFVKVFLEKYDRLNVLVNNAGIMMCPYGKTQDGFELQMGCNHLGHFLLQQLLTPLLLQTAETTGQPSRFIALSSVAATETSMSKGIPDIDLEDLNWETREYHEVQAYSASKLANYLHANHAATQYPADKLLCVSVHPGWVRSNLDVHAFAKMFGTSWFGRTMSTGLRNVMQWKGDMISAEDGAQTTLHCILHDTLDPGAFYSQFGIYKRPEDRAGGWPLTPMPNPNATPEKAAALWKASVKLVGLAA